MTEYARGGFVSGSGEPLVFIGKHDGYLLPKGLVDKWLTDPNFRDALAEIALRAREDVKYDE